jgi:hypothetical protein
LGPQLRIVYALILNFAVSGGLEINGMVHGMYTILKGILTFEISEDNLVARHVSFTIYPYLCLLQVSIFQFEIGL